MFRRLDARTVRVLGGPREMLTVLEDFARGEGGAAAGVLEPGVCASWRGWRLDVDATQVMGRASYEQLMGQGGLQPMRVATGLSGRGRELSVFTEDARTGREDFRYTLLLGDVVLGIRGEVDLPERHVYDVTLRGVAHLLVRALRRVHARCAAHGDTAVLVFTAQEAEQLRQGARDWCAATGDEGCPEWVLRVADAESAEEALRGLITSTDDAARIAERLLELGAFLLESEAAMSRDWPGVELPAWRQE
ncbi:hypothetical protein [Myxococcus fulvus]|uniref:hypothetical protein n=1 Tax=Myxococcus fulvus TaxID=33 RepID=UPI001160B875|nr:hypothetical protein [Myxococcus fulvus]